MIKREEQRLGNYRLSRLLGTGVFADVYLGEHLYLNTLAAIKVLHAPLDPQAQASFLTEARHLSRLIHPHIIRLLEFGLQDQVPYLIMDIEVGEANMTLGNSHLYVQNLPGSLTPMIGREHDLQAAYARLLRPHVRLLTLTGTLGVGKTRLALALGDRMLDEFAQGVCFVSLASINDPDLLIPTIIRTFGLPESRDHSPFEQLVAYLRDKQLLLLLDNFEHLLPAASRLSELLAACPQLKLLVTSRATLHVQGEYEFAVPPLAIPDPQSLARARPAYETLSQMAAVELFVQCAEAARPGFALTEENAAVIAEICVRLEGLPLAIELAAARCKVLSLQALLSRLEHRLAVLTGGRQDAPLRQQTLRDTIAWSYDLLSPEMQMLFRCLCVFVGDFTLDAAEAVVSAAVAPTASILDGIISLVDSSLVQRRDEEGIGTRLHILEALREYGMERLAAHEELERCQNAHAVHYLALAEQAEPALDSATQVPWLAVLEREYDNIRAAVQWLLERREVEALGEEAQAVALETGNTEDLARVLWGLGHLALRQGNLAEAREMYMNCVKRMQGKLLIPRLKWVVASCLEGLGEIALAGGAGEQTTWAVQLIGAAEAVRSAHGYYSPLCIEQPFYDRTLGAARTQLGEKAFAVAWTTGQTMTPQQALVAVSHFKALPQVEVLTIPPAMPEPSPTPVIPNGLTAREVEVLRLVALGMSNSHIAEQLVLSPNTVNAHIQSIYRKVDVNSRSAATRFAMEHQLI